jgi:hypothetical protein
MKISQKLWTLENGWVDIAPKLPGPPQLVLVFGARSLLEDQKHFDEIRSFYPNSNIVECSTSGEIMQTHIYDNTIAVTAILFEQTEIHCVETDITKAEDSFETGAKLADMLPKKDLVHAMVFSDGMHINGTTLVKGLSDKLPPNVSITGGLAGDAGNFKKTALGLNHVAEEGKIILIGFSGKNLKVGYGSFGGWNTFGIERTITKSKDNVVYEIDNKPALELYKNYLGDKAKELPGAGILFPFKIHRNHGSKAEMVRSLMKVNEKDQSVTFAGDMPEGSTGSLMKANVENLIDGAAQASSMSIKPFEGKNPDLSILISCFGRKVVLKEQTEEEVEAAQSVIGKNTIITGFYSYGEICPIDTTEKQCHFHNQTMTITNFREN